MGWASAAAARAAPVRFLLTYWTTQVLCPLSPFASLTILPHPCHRHHPTLPQPDLAASVNIDLLSAVFGSYGFVKKLVTFTKPGGTAMVAWVQFPDAQIATSVSSAGPPPPQSL